MEDRFAARRADFRRLHQQGCFVIPNPWDVGGAKHLQKIGFKAIASTGAGLAWSLGRNDRELTLHETLGHLEALCSATELPVNADFEAGYASSDHGVFENVVLAIRTGVAGLSIEDREGRELISAPRAVARIRAAKAAIVQSGHDVVLVGRSEGHFIGRSNLDETIERLVAYSEAGADCLFAPGVFEIEDIARVVAAVSPKPVNVMITGPAPSVGDLAAIGVRRVSVGASLAAEAWRSFEDAAEMLRRDGRLPDRRR